MIIPGREYVNPTLTILAAKDPVGVPTEPAVLEIAEKALCLITLGHNCFLLTNVYGHIAEVPYGASLEEWEKIAYGLLDRAMKEDA